MNMTRSGAIQRTILVNDQSCKVWYKGMPITCDICEGSHKARDCPYKGLCMRCRQPGHVQRDCFNAPNAWGTEGGGAVASGDSTPADAEIEAPSSPPLFSSLSVVPPSVSSDSEVVPPSSGDAVSTGEAASVASATPLGSLPSWGSAADLSDGKLPPSSVVDDLVREAGLGSDHIFSPLSDIEVSGELDSSDDATDDNGIVKRSDGIKVQSSASIGNESNGIIVKGSNGREVQSSASSCNESNGIIIKGSNGMELQSSASTLNENRNNIEKPLSGDNATDKNSNDTVKVPQNVKAAINNNSVSGSNVDGSSCSSLSSQAAPPSEVEMVEASPARKRGLPPAETSSDSSSAPSPRKKQAKAAKKSGTVPPPRKASSSGAKLGSLSPASTSRRNQRS